ncbi:hypothetical protein EVA_19155, partial [gut metagenome]
EENMLKTDLMESPFRGMGEALLRMARRHGYRTDDRLALMLSALMKGFYLAEAEGSVCVSREDIARLLTARRRRTRIPKRFGPPCPSRSRRSGFFRERPIRKRCGWLMRALRRSGRWGFSPG